MFSGAKRGPWWREIPAILLGTTLLLAGVMAVPTAVLGGTDSLVLMILGAGVGLLTVLAGYFFVRIAFRRPDRFGVKLVVGGFVFRVVLLGLVLFGVLRATGIPLERFVLWIVFFYFSLVMAEAWALARQSSLASEGSR
jgi:hypothetical protein